jgi:hypothetical protein
MLVWLGWLVVRLVRAQVVMVCKIGMQEVLQTAKSNTLKYAEISVFYSNKTDFSSSF